METSLAILLALKILGLLCGAGALGFWAYSNYRIERVARPHCYDDLADVPARETGLVLGCTRILRSGRPNRYFAYRIEAAAGLFHAGKVERILVSGASHRGEVDEAQSMQEALVEQGVPEARIVCDRFGYRTLDSVLRAEPVFGIKAPLIISQRFHVERALYIASKAGIDAIGFAARDVPFAQGRLVRQREAFARMRALLDMGVLRTGPRTLER